MENRHQQALNLIDWKNWKWGTYSDIKSNIKKAQLIAAVVQRHGAGFVNSFRM